MPRYQIEVYELYTSWFEVEASDKEEAIAEYKKGKAIYSQNSTTYIEVADVYGRKLEALGLNEEKLKSLDIFVFPKMFHTANDVVIKPTLPGIRSIEEVEE